ncbi:MAG: HDIG domain-containing metalloprotein [Bdellovibrionota bacterium]
MSLVTVMNFAIGFLFGGAMIFAIKKAVARMVLKEAQVEASELLKDAQDQFQLEEDERNEVIQEIELTAWGKVEEAHLLMEGRCTDLELQITERKKSHEETDKTNRGGLFKMETDLRELSMRLADQQKSFQVFVDQLVQIKQGYQNQLHIKTQLKEEEVIQDITSQLITEANQDFESYINIAEEEHKEFAEAKAKRILGLCIDRFNKEMSTERNIASTYFPDEKIRAHFCHALKENVAAVEEVTGCDIYIDEIPDPERLLNIQVIGYDPVRRELTRRLFEKLFKDIEKQNKPLPAEHIRKTGENLKAELLKQIKKDGDLQAKELAMQNIHPEIRQVMGSLRYRYSYTQNQYFHCAEVGWFASLLAGEIRADIKKSKRAGLLHDLGKALDHQFDGSHAVIGADFIEARGEDPEVVHAVRAHHYDVQPEADMDFLVIAADAISGGRPGARRSTMETYTQKVTGLQEISKRFQGVTDVFVLNGGRECRVLVNSRQVDDLGALQIAEKIAKTIEEEMQYPGQIKVVVVRETIVSESRQSHHGERGGGGRDNHNHRR